MTNTENKTVDILGTTYTVKYLSAKEDKRLKKADGYCDFHSRLIVICKDENGNIHDYKPLREKVLRHEITHAFFYESGLTVNTFVYNGAWAENEELVDWIAIQGPKIYKAWKSVKAI